MPSELDELIETSDDNIKCYHKCLTSSDNRSQVLYHAALLGVEDVLFTVSKGGRNARGEILYIAWITFSKQLVQSFTQILQAIQRLSFTWTMESTPVIPNTYKELVCDSFASDMHTFQGFFHLQESLLKLVVDHNCPLPPSRMLRPTFLVAWNALKRGVDEYLRYMKFFANSKASEDPSATVVPRLLGTQALNAAICYRILQARKSLGLPRDRETLEPHRRGYYNIRKKITKTISVADFVRLVSEQWSTTYSSRVISGLRGRRTFKPSSPCQGTMERMSPRYAKGARVYFNMAQYKTLRLNGSAGHKKLSCRKRRCDLCGWV